MDMYDPLYTRAFYDAYGENEWMRLERTTFGRLEAVIHADFLGQFVKEGDRVLDAGSGPGRFSIAMAKMGAIPTLLDISPNQLSLARSKIAEAGIFDHVAQFQVGDICDLSDFTDGAFDAVVCFGGALSYVCEKRGKAAQEIKRVTKPGGTILASVMSKNGAAIGVVRQPDIPYLTEPDRSGIYLDGMPGLWEFVRTGDLPGFPSHIGINHAAMHLYTAHELVELFDDCQVLKVAGTCVTLSEYQKPDDEITREPVWSNVVELEKRLNTQPGLVDCGSHIIIAARKVA